MSSTISSAELHAETRLRALIARGFRFLHPRDAQGDPVAVVGVRVPSTEENVLAPTRTWWRSAGPVCEVLDDLLGLPDRTRGHAASGHAPGHAAGEGRRASGQGRAKWLAAEA